MSIETGSLVSIQAENPQAYKGSKISSSEFMPTEKNPSLAKQAAGYLIISIGAYLIIDGLMSGKPTKAILGIGLIWFGRKLTKSTKITYNS